MLFLVPNALALARNRPWYSPVVVWCGFVRWTIWNTLFFIFIVQASLTNPVRNLPGGVLHCFCGVASMVACAAWLNCFPACVLTAVHLHACNEVLKKLMRRDAIMMDAPLWLHWPKLPMWLGFEAVQLALALQLVTDPSPQPAPLPQQSCRDVHYDCTFSSATLVLVALTTGFILGYLVMYLIYVLRTFRVFKTLPYNQYRMGNVVIRLQVRLRGLALVFFVLSAISYTWVGFNTCPSFIISWYGYAPMQVGALSRRGPIKLADVLDRW